MAFYFYTRSIARQKWRVSIPDITGTLEFSQTKIIIEIIINDQHILLDQHCILLATLATLPAGHAIVPKLSQHSTSTAYYWQPWLHCLQDTLLCRHWASTRPALHITGYPGYTACRTRYCADTEPALDQHCILLATLPAGHAIVPTLSHHSTSTAYYWLLWLHCLQDTLLCWHWASTIAIITPPLSQHLQHIFQHTTTEA
jgi:hypothetical protein